MEDLTKFVVNITEDLGRDLSRVINQVFADLYVEYEMNPTHKNLNSVTTILYDVFYALHEKNIDILKKLPTLEELMDLFQSTIRAEIPELYGEDYDFLQNHVDIEDEVFLTADIIPMDFRVANIRHLEGSIRRNSCCKAHKDQFEAHLQLFELANTNKFTWDYDMIDFTYEHTFTNLRALEDDVKNHRLAYGKIFKK